MYFKSIVPVYGKRDRIARIVGLILHQRGTQESVRLQCYVILSISFQLTFINSFCSIVESYSTIYIWATGFECRLRCHRSPSPVICDHHPGHSPYFSGGDVGRVFLGCYPGCYHPCKMTYRLIHSIKPHIFQVGI